MDNYIKSVFIALIVVFFSWDIVCIGVIPPQGQTLINNKAASSASFIQQETNQQPIGQNTHVSNTPQPPRSNNRGATRDYVNPGGATNQQNPNITPAQFQQNLPSQSNTGNTRGGIRDYVNPQAPQNNPVQRQNPPGNNKGVATTNSPQTNSKYITPSVNRGSVRDYVNPNAGRINPSTTVRPSDQQQPNSYANAANPTKPNTNIRDYVAPQRPQFPPLPNSGQNQKPAFPALPSPTGPVRSPTPTGVASTTPISYANKVAGGVTTKSPLSSPTGPPSGSSTTEKPDDGPTDTELREFSEALLRRDVNNAAQHITINYQGKTTSQSQNDEAPQKLLEIKPEAFQISTISKLKQLHNNYILDTNENEHVTAQEKAEENELLDAMLTTPIMQFTRNFLIAKGKLSKDPKDFKNLLKVLWFNMYSRGGGRIGSSGFEHIFLAETKKNNEVSGLHNWVYFDQAEINKIVDYLGYMKKVDLGEKGVILKFHFKLNGIDKPVDSMFIGTSPELEVALYTTCYIFRADRICPLRLNGNNFIVRTFNFRYRGKNMIGSAFPEI